MTDTRGRFDRHAAWQRGRAALTWPEKVRMAEGVREGAAQLSRTRRAITAGLAGTAALPASRYPMSGQPAAFSGAKLPRPDEY